MRYISLLILLLSSVFLKAQDVEFTVDAPDIVEVGEQFQLRYSINKNATGLKLPPMGDFELLMGPMTGMQTSFSNINGKVTNTTTHTYTYLLAGLKEGVYTLAPASIMVDGEEYKSESVRIEVVKGEERSGESISSSEREHKPKAVTKDNLFAKTQVNRRNIYIGESMVASFKIFSNVDLTNLGNVKFPSFEGFLVEDIPGPQRIELKREKYNERLYNAATIRQVLLYPQQSGEITIDPYDIECHVSTGIRLGDSFFDDFFASSVSRTQRVLRRSEPVKITVKDLPMQGKPADFTGAVGKFNIKALISTSNLKANDALSYKIVVSGQGNLKLINAPKIKFPHEFEAYDPKITKDIKVGANGMEGSVTFEYLLIPRYAGEYTLNDFVFTYFDPNKEAYVNASSRSYKITVEKSDNNTSVQTPGNVAVESFKKEDVVAVGEDIRYVKTGNLNLKEKGIKFYGTMQYWFSFIIPILLFVVGAMLNRRRIIANADVVRVKNKSANKLAKKRLKLAAEAMKNHNSEAFYDEILKSLWSYVSFKLNIDMSDLSKDNIKDKLSAKSISVELVDEFIGVLNACEFARFSPSRDIDKQMDEIYSQSIDIITKLDKSIK